MEELLLEGRSGSGDEGTELKGVGAGIIGNWLNNGFPYFSFICSTFAKFSCTAAVELEEGNLKWGLSWKIKPKQNQNTCIK